MASNHRQSINFSAIPKSGVIYAINPRLTLSLRVFRPVEDVKSEYNHLIDWPTWWPNPTDSRKISNAANGYLQDIIILNRTKMWKDTLLSVSSVLTLYRSIPNGLREESSFELQSYLRNLHLFNEKGLECHARMIIYGQRRQCGFGEWQRWRWWRQNGEHSLFKI